IFIGSSDDNRYLSSYEISSEQGETVVLSLSVAILDCYVLVFDIARFGQGPEKCREIRRHWSWRSGMKKSDHRHRRLLRARCERPRRRAANKRDELAPPHLIISSAPQSLWQATKHEHNARPVGSAQANVPEVFSVESDDFPAAKHMCESSVDREPKCPISSRQHYCKRLERRVVRKQRKVPQTLSPR